MRKNPEKNLTQETCPDRGLNPGPLRDRRACYRLAHSGGHMYSGLSHLHVSVLVFFGVLIAIVIGFTTLLTSQVISVAFYSEREKSHKFCSEALISAWGSFTYVNLRRGTHGFTCLPKEIILRIFTLWKNPSTPAGFEPTNLGSSGEYDNHGTTVVDLVF